MGLVVVVLGFDGRVELDFAKEGVKEGNTGALVVRSGAEFFEVDGFEGCQAVN